jgi:hypothetical protein
VGTRIVMRDWKTGILRRTFGAWEKLGIYITPVHFYHADSR